MVERRYDVIVVGAGVSGLAAARELRAAGCRTLTLEARDRIGGRLCTDRSCPAIAFDMGASWIHGPRGNPIEPILRNAGATLLRTDYYSNTFYNKCGELNQSKIQIDLAGAVEGFYRFIVRRKKNIYGDESLAMAFEHFLRRKKLSREQELVLRHIMRVEIETTYGAEMSDLSLQGFNEDEEFKGGDVFVASGYDALANQLAYGLAIQIDSPVDDVRDDGVSVKICVGAAEYEAGHVVITVPLGVLQKGVISFSPGLSRKKAMALTRLRMGNLHKTFLQFASNFWDDTQTIDILHGGTRWNEFINLAKQIDNPVLLALNGGEAASELRKMSKDEIANEIFSVLRQAYPHATRPLSVTTTAWEDDRWTYGSYSFVPVGASLEMYDDLARSQGRVFFAGEHTSSDYPATVHGAYLSGIRAAKNLIRQRASKTPSL